MIVCSMALSIATSRPGPELQHVRGVALQGLAARVHDDELGAALGRVLEEGRGDRMVLGRVGADDDDHVGVLGGHERRRHGARADALHQAATDEAWQSRVQWSTLLVPKPVRTSFWNR